MLWICSLRTAQATWCFTTRLALNWRCSHQVNSKSCRLNLDSPRKDKMTSCVVTGSSSREQGWTVRPCCLRWVIGTFVSKSNWENKRPKLKSSHFVWPFTWPFQHCADWSKARFPPADVEHILWCARNVQAENQRKCHRHAAGLFTQQNPRLQRIVWLIFRIKMIPATSTVVVMLMNKDEIQISVCSIYITRVIWCSNNLNILYLWPLHLNVLCVTNCTHSQFLPV